MLGHTLIVGGGASIAPEIITEFARASTRVTVTYRNPPVAISADNVEALPCDLATPGATGALACALEQRGSGINVVLLLAGTILGKSLAETTDDDMEAIVTTNLTGPARLIRDLLPVLDPCARILLLSSVSGERGSFDPMYSATKGALIPFAKSLATWMAPRLTVTVVAPGAIADSAMVRGMSRERIDQHIDSTPTGELLTRSDLALILVDLAHPHWRHANGAVISINGASHV